MARVTVIGAGPGGIATAAGLTERGHEVTLAARSRARLDPIDAAGGVDVDDAKGRRLVPLAATTSDIAGSVDAAEVVLVAVPANGQEPVLGAIAPRLDAAAALVLMPGSCGSLVAAGILREAGHDIRAGVLLGETVTLPYSGRMTGPATVRVRLPSRLRAAALPAARNDEFAERIGALLDLRMTPSVLDPGLNNPNFLIHPAPMLLNWAEIERRDGQLSIMNEGMTAGVLRCLDAMDAEKMAVCAALGLDRVDIDRIYTEAGADPSVYRSPGEPFNLTDRIWPRYVTEDVPYGSVMIASFAGQLGIPAPISTGVSDLLSVAAGTDFWAEGRTVERVGLAGRDAAGIADYCATGT